MNTPAFSCSRPSWAIVRDKGLPWVFSPGINLYESITYFQSNNSISVLGFCICHVKNEWVFWIVEWQERVPDWMAVRSCGGRNLDCCRMISLHIIYWRGALGGKTQPDENHEDYVNLPSSRHWHNGVKCYELFNYSIMFLVMLWACCVGGSTSSTHTPRVSLPAHRFGGHRK